MNGKIDCVKVITGTVKFSSALRGQKKEIVDFVTKAENLPLDAVIDIMQRFASGRTALFTSSTSIDWNFFLVRPDKYAIVEEFQTKTQSVLVVSKFWPYHQRFVTL